MAFESLSERLNKAFKNISGQGKLTEKNMNDMLKRSAHVIIRGRC